MANWAVVIGINTYQRVKSLKYAHNDAKLMENFFNSQNFEQIFCFTEDSQQIPFPDNSWQDSKPTYSNIMSFLAECFEKKSLSAEDNFWFFFSGHGVRHQGQDFLMPCDGNFRLIEQTNIPLSYVTARLRRSGAGNIILLLDACRNENEFNSKSPSYQNQKGVITIASCSPKEESYEIPELQQGSFTYALVEGLKIQGEGNCATVERLYNHLRYRVPEINLQYHKPPQLPYGIVEPPTKFHYILLPKQATLQDIATLTLEAVNAEGEGDFELARSLIKRVLAISPTDGRAWKIHDRIFAKMHYTLNKVGTNFNQDLEESNQQVPVFNDNLGKSAKSENKSPLAPFNKEGIIQDLGNGIKLEMVYIPAGEFMMGTDDEEIEKLCKKYNTDWFKYEQPIHKVTFKQGFYIGKYPITQAQYSAIMGNNPSEFKGENNPVECVSWNDAQEFCQKLSDKIGKKYKLPSESQWEYACRAGSKTKWCFGDNENELKNYAWYVDNSGDSPFDSLKLWQTDSDNYWDKIRANNCRTHPLGQKEANKWGLYDMHGNVWEWCADNWHGNYNNAHTDGSEWTDKSNSDHVLRGGSWHDDLHYCRSANRSLNSRNDFNNEIGFRIVLCVGSSS